MHAPRILLAVVGLGMFGMLPFLVAAQTQPSTDSGKAGLSAEQVFSRVSPAVVRVVVRDREFKEIGFGSGFFVAPDGLLVTNHHVVRGAEFATVLRADGSTLFVDGILALDEGRDLALLKVNGTGLPCLEVAAADAPPPVGTQVYAVGNPMGLTNTLSNGLVSGIRKEGGEVRDIQTSAAVSPGSSGGPLVDAQGRVVGVIKSYMVNGQALNFAVPAAAVRALLAKAATGKPAPLASAGGKPLDRAATRELDAAYAAIAEKRWSDAVRILTGLRSRQPDNPFVWYALGYLQIGLGNRELAVEAYKTAIRLKPDFAKAYCDLGTVYGMLDRRVEAVAAYKTAILLKPDFADVYLNLGVFYSLWDRRVEAIEALKTAIRLKPDNASAYLNLGSTYLEMGNRAEALRAYQALQRLDPATAEKLRALIERLPESTKQNPDRQPPATPGPDKPPTAVPIPDLPEINSTWWRAPDALTKHVELRSAMSVTIPQASVQMWLQRNNYFAGQPVQWKVHLFGRMDSESNSRYADKNSASIEYYKCLGQAEVDNKNKSRPGATKREAEMYGGHEAVCRGEAGAWKILMDAGGGLSLLGITASTGAGVQVHLILPGERSMAAYAGTPGHHAVLVQGKIVTLSADGATPMAVLTGRASLSAD